MIHQNDFIKRKTEIDFTNRFEKSFWKTDLVNIFNQSKYLAVCNKSKLV